MQNHILIIDDDDKIRKLLSRFFMNHNYIVTTSQSSKNAKIVLDHFIFDLIILDVMMPVISGIDFLKTLRNSISTPVIMLTALGNINDRVNGLESGADDYIAKPFAPKELLLRVQKLIKRTNIDVSKCVFGHYIFDLESNSLKHNEEHIYLTNNESKLLNLLVNNVGKIVNRNLIVSLFEGSSFRTIDVIVARLRIKIEANTKAPAFLQTIRNRGYILWGKLI